MKIANNRRRYISPAIRISSVNITLMLMSSHKDPYDDRVPDTGGGDIDINVNPDKADNNDGEGWDAGDAF